MKLTARKRSLIRAIVSVSSAIGVTSFVLSPATAYRPLSNREVNALNHLAYPQSGRAMLSRFGRPLSSDGYSDWYPVGSGGMAQVSYLGNRAQYTQMHP
jgi:hypothetical protein